MCYEQRESRNIVMGEGQGTGSPQEDGTRANDAAAIVNNRPGGTVQVHDGLQISQQQSQNSTVQWERFLPTRSIKVLLVENDDSTRHVVSALLRNCSYEVTGVANGLQAWRVLKDFNNHIDLILTEVAMPIVSGIGLLCKIMSHKTFKNIPVIMMSSHDSMGIVFKCLSKGAVDFLVKPIRKNELKNLWQHVWRRCHSSSGSGSESGTQTKKSVKSKGNEESGNNSDSCNELDDNGSNGLSARGGSDNGSDNGSGTQSSWTKRAAEFDSPQPTLPSIQVADAPDSTCAQVVHTNPEVFGDQWIGITEKKECQEKNEEHDDVAMGKDLEIGVSRKPDLQRDCLCEMTSHPIIKRQNKLSEVDSKPFENGKLEHKSENISNKPRERASKAINANCTNLHVESKRIDVSNCPDDVLQLKDKACSDSGGLPSVELSLKRLRGVGDGGSAANDDRNVLRHSDLSAFSKYNTSSSASQGQTGNVGSCSPLGNSSDAKKTETAHDMTCHPNGTILNQPSNGSSNNNDMASTSKKAPLKTEALNDKSESTSAFKSFNSSAFQSVQNGLVSSPQQVKPSSVDDVGHVTVQAQFRGSRQQVQVQHHHHHHHHYHHDVHVIQQHQSQPDHDDLSLKNMAEDAQQCGSSNMVGGPTEGIARNYSVNGSASGSNHGSNGKNGSSAVLNTGLANMDSDNAAAANVGAGGSNGRVSGNAVGEDRVAQREAALCKFRQKRKERCFEKRVRYHSRKKLAEQRPRVKGQFVRQIVSDTKPGRDSHGNYFTSEDNSCDSIR